MWNKITHLGVTNQLDRAQKKHLIILNLINVLFIFAFLTSIILILYDNYAKFNVLDFNFYRYLAAFFLGLFHLFLNYKEKYQLSKILLLFDIPLIFLYPVLFLGLATNINYISLPYTILLFSIIPHFVFTAEKEIKWVYLSIVIYIILQSSVYTLLNYFAIEKVPITQIIEKF